MRAASASWRTPAAGRATGSCRSPSPGLAALGHRGAFGADGESSDGAGVALPLDRSLLELVAGDLAAAAARVVSVFLPRARRAERRGRAPRRGRLRRCRPARRPLAGRPLRRDRARRRRRRLAPAVRPGDRDADRSTRRPPGQRRRLRAPPGRRPAPARDGRPRRPARPRRALRPVGVVPDASSTRASSRAPGCRSSSRTSGRRCRSRTRSSTSATRRTPIRCGGSPSRSASIAHNGEINTVRGNREQVRGRTRRSGREGRSRPSSSRPARSSRRMAPTRSRSTRRSSC